MMGAVTHYMIATNLANAIPVGELVSVPLFWGQLLEYVLAVCTYPKKAHWPPSTNPR